MEHPYEGFVNNLNCRRGPCQFRHETGWKITIIQHLGPFSIIQKLIFGAAIVSGLIKYFGNTQGGTKLEFSWSDVPPTQFESVTVRNTMLSWRLTRYICGPGVEDGCNRRGLLVHNFQALLPMSIILGCWEWKEEPKFWKITNTLLTLDPKMSLSTLWKCHIHSSKWS
jgi:hypothetical protein